MKGINIFNIHIGACKARFKWIPYFSLLRLRWKDKFGTPRCELKPSLRFNWLGFEISFILGDDQYWEQWLWIKKYNNGDEKKAKENYPWIDVFTKESAWKDY